MPLLPNARHGFVCHDRIEFTVADARKAIWFRFSMDTPYCLSEASNPRLILAQDRFGSSPQPQMREVASWK